jgi:hypothetical protein
MKLPTRIAVTLTTALTGLMALSAEVHMSHPAHVTCLIAGGLLLGLFVHPGEAGTIPAAAGGIPTPTHGSNQTPAPPL